MNASRLVNAIFRPPADWLARFYFQPTGPAGLAICRAWLYGFLAFDCWRVDYSRWAEFSQEFWHPIWLFAWLDRPAFTAELLHTAQLAYIFALAACSAGLWFRVSSGAAFVLALSLYGLQNCFGKVDHSQTLSVFALGIFALSHAGRVWSLDAWIARRRGRPAPELSSEYQWPIRLLQALMATVFLAAGIAKLRWSGLGWIISDNLRNILLTPYYTSEELPSLAYWIAQYPLMCKVMAGLTVLVELTAPLAVFSRRYRWFVIPSLLAMQLGIYFAMNISFWPYLALYVVWIEWNELRLPARVGRSQTAADGELPASLASRRAA